MKIKFTSHIRKGNNNSTGFFYIPKGKINLFNLGDWVRIGLSRNIYFFSRIIFYSHRLGVYIPRRLMKENDLLDKAVKIQMEKVDGFYAKMYSDGRIYVPKEIVENQKLKHNDVVLIKGIEGDKVVQEKYSKINVIRRENRPVEYTCVFNKTFHTKEILFKIEKQPQEVYKEKLSSLTTQLLRDMYYAFIDSNSVIIFKGNKVPAIIHPNLKYSDIAFYLGAYFADGTKKGNSWAICASTFEQARYYLKMHNLLIKGSKPKFIISFTNINKVNQKVLERKLANVWKNKAGIKVDRLRIRESTGRSPGKWNKHGTLVIKEHGQILLDFYNNLLQLLIKEIVLKQDRKLAIDFLCGVMEGDGSVPARKRGHVVIFTNKNDIHILEDILRIAKIKFKSYVDGENKYALRIGALEILKNLSRLKNKLFILYPKRKLALFERLKTVKATEFLIGDYKPYLWVKR